MREVGRLFVLLFVFGADISLAQEKSPRLVGALRGEPRPAKAGELDTEGFMEIPRGGLVPPGPSFIIGGGAAGPSEYPWMAALVVPGFTASSSQFCGGTVIHPWWVITAAHCVIHQRAEDIEVVVGTTDLTNLSGAQRIGVAEVIMHPDYNDYTSDSDLALLRLKAPANVTPLPLIDEVALEAVGITSTVTGWGLTTPTGSGTSQLQEVEVPIVSLAVANAVPDYAGSLTANMLPAGFSAGGKDSCNGDSGGPLMVPSPVGPGMMLAGLVSFGGGVCAAPNTYGIYTRVSNFRNYVLGHIWPNYAAYEASEAVIGELRDPNNDGWTHWDDFALPGGRLVAERLGMNSSISFLRPTNADEVSYDLERNATLMGGWDPVDVDTNFISSTEVGDGTSWWKVASPLSPAAADFFRLVTGTTSNLVSGPRRITVPGSAQGGLDEEDVEHPGLAGRKMKVYQLDPVAGGTSLAVSLRSVDFDARLELLDGAGVVVQTAASDSGQGRLGEDERLAFTTAASTDYFLRVTTEGAGEFGSYQLAIWKPADLAGLTALSMGGSGQSGSLSASDDLEPLFQPEFDAYHDPFRLDLTGWSNGQMVELAMDSSGGSDIDDFIILYHGETGAMIRMADDRVGPGLPQAFDNNTSLFFLPDPGVEYVVHATSATVLDAGSYTLKATAGPGVIGSIGLSQTISSNLSSSDRVDGFGSYFEDRLLAAGAGGQTIRVTMSGPVLDPFLEIYDAQTGVVIAQDDDSGGSLNALLDFELQPGGRYLIRATTAVEDDPGSYTLTTQILP